MDCLQAGGPILTAISTLYAFKGPCSHTSIHDICACISLSTKDLLHDTLSELCLGLLELF